MRNHHGIEKTQDNAPALEKIKQRFDARAKAYRAHLQQQKEAFNRIPMEDFPGMPFSPAGLFTIKLPVDMYDSLRPRNSGVYRRRIEGLLVDRQNKDTSIYAFHDGQRVNLFKYDAGSTSNINDRYFLLKNGLIDSQGNFIIANPDDGYFEFSEIAPFILASKWKKMDEDDTYRKTPEGFVFDARGKRLLHSALFEGIVEQRLAISGDDKKLGLYDLNAKKWLLKPMYNEPDWHNGVFIAANVNEMADADGALEKSGMTNAFLPDKDGRVLVEGKRIKAIDEIDRIIVVGDRNRVGLVDKKGTELFSHSGRDMEFVSQINGYAVEDTNTGSKEKRVGIVSDRGEVIIPFAYGAYLVQDGYLKMMSPGFTQASFFKLDAVKDWRNHQPLRPAPEPR